MREPNFKVAYVPWYRPVRLAQRNADKDGWDFIGWVWRQRAYMVKNLHYGWIAFVEDQAPENIDTWFCDHCGASLWGSRRNQIIKAVSGREGGGE